MGATITYQERKKIKDGTQSVRFGVDSQLPFGYCALTLGPVVDPIVTPSGHMYSREAIFEHMLTKTHELKRQRALYEAQEARRAAAAEEKVAATSSKRAEAFVASQMLLTDKKTSAPPLSSSSSTSSASSALVVHDVSVGSSATGAFQFQKVSSSSSNHKGKKRKADLGSFDDHDDYDDQDRDERAATVKQLSAKVGERTTKAQLKQSSYWVPQFAPKHIEEQIAPPPKRPPSPSTGEGLRMKDLFSVNLIVDPDTTDTLDKKYQCAVTQKQITFQDAVLLKKPANAVILASFYRDLVEPNMTCPITGQKIKAKDVVHLVKAGSSFAAAGKVKAEKYTHSVT